MNNMTIRLRMLACITAAAAASLAFLTTYLASAAPAKKPTTPTAKSAIYGTPAQLVEDLKSAGIDLANARFTRTELLKKPKTHEKGYVTFEFANCSLAVNEKGNLVSFSLRNLDSKADDSTSFQVDEPNIDIGELVNVLTMKKQDVLSRYGEEYARRDYGPNLYHEPDYMIIVNGSQKSYWSLDFMIPGSDEYSANISGSMRSSNVAEAHIIKKDGLLFAQGEGGTLYNDLLDAGVNVGMPSSHPEILKEGRLQEFPLQPTPTVLYTFYDMVIAEEVQGSVTYFQYMNRSKFTWNNALAWMKLCLRRIRAFPMSALISTAKDGRDAVLDRYGTEFNSRWYLHESENVTYCLLLNYQGEYKVIRLQFWYGEETPDGDVAGMVVSEKPYIYSIPE